MWGNSITTIVKTLGSLSIISWLHKSKSTAIKKTKYNILAELIGEAAMVNQKCELFRQVMCFTIVDKVFYNIYL